MKIKILDSYEDVSGLESMVIAVGQNEREETLSRLEKEAAIPIEIPKQDFEAEAKELSFFYPPSGSFFTKRLVLAGLGEKPASEIFRQTLRSLVHQSGKKLSKQLAIDFLEFPPVKFSDPAVFSAWMQAAAEGCLLGQYEIGKFKTETSKPKAPLRQLEELLFFVPGEWGQPAREAANRAEIIVAAQQKVFDLVNAPGNVATPEMLAETAAESAKKWGYSITVLSKKEIEKEGLGGLLAVNKGSDLPPKFIIMEYKPQPKGKEGYPKVGLVGKGVTFDTGGISLKTGPNVHYMKSDMAGGGAVIGAMEAAARLKLPVHLIGIVPATDNKTGGSAQNPGDIITTYAGISVEVEDTDAEGRLILADGLAYLKKHFNPDVIIDLATLTGASVISLGNAAAALFSNNDDLAGKLSEAAEKTGEKVWRFPLWDEYNKLIDSTVADVKNYGGPPAGAITAAKFLEKFIDGHPAWAHLDIAGVAFTESDFAKGKSATAYGVRLLLEYLSTLKDNSPGFS